jgi:hypothetical protein
MEVSHNVGLSEIRDSLTRHELGLDPKLNQIVERVRQEAAEHPHSVVRLVLTVEAERGAAGPYGP